MLILCLTKKTQLAMPGNSDIFVTEICLDSRGTEPAKLSLEVYAAHSTGL